MVSGCNSHRLVARGRFARGRNIPARSSRGGKTNPNVTAREVEAELDLQRSSSSSPSSSPPPPLAGAL